MALRRPTMQRRNMSIVDICTVVECFVCLVKQTGASPATSVPNGDYVIVLSRLANTLGGKQIR
eukprot:9484212-Pyramimonas_sp.AAC.1